MSRTVRGLTRAVVRRARRVAVAPRLTVAGPTAVYAGVLDGDCLWCAVDVTGAPDASALGLRDRAGRISKVDAVRVREGEQHRLEALVPLSGLESDPEGVVLDLVVVDSGGRAMSVRTGPSTTLRDELGPSDDLRWRRRAYRTGKGTVAVEVRPLEACAAVRELSLAPGLVRIMASVVPRGTLDDTARLSLRQRQGTASVGAPVSISGDDLEVDLPIAELGREVTSDLETWDVFVVTDSLEIRVGRRLSDLRNVRQAVRYLSTAHSLDDGRRLAVRPYYTNDRFLALEVRAVDRSEPLDEGVLSR